jgi:hypothetical protein
MEVFEQNMEIKTTKTGIKKRKLEWSHCNLNNSHFFTSFAYSNFPDFKTSHIQFVNNRFSVEVHKIQASQCIDMLTLQPLLNHTMDSDRHTPRPS